MVRDADPTDRPELIYRGCTCPPFSRPARGDGGRVHLKFSVIFFATTDSFVHYLLQFEYTTPQDELRNATRSLDARF